MKVAGQLLRIACLAATAILALACSWTTDFVVVNASAGTVEVQYRAKPHDQGVYGEVVLPPRVARATELGSGSWTTAATEANGEEGITRVRLAPGQALLIARARGYGSPTLEHWRRFPLQHLQIGSALGMVCHEGAAILLAFQGNRERQVFIFSGTTDQFRLSSCGGSPNPSLQRTPPG
jgi:hypothetical protein